MAPEGGAGASAEAVRALAALVAIGLAARLLLVWSGWGDDYLVTDDAYYYFAIARNLVAGHGSTFDGLAPTNGYHPLYMALILPGFALAAALHASAWFPVRLALTLCAAFDAVTAVLLFRFLRRGFSGRGALWAAGLWLLSPFTLLVSMRGVESSVDAAVVMAWLLFTVRALSEGVPDFRRASAIGALTGLAMLARTDNGPLLAAAYAVALVLACRRTGASLLRAGWALAVTGVMAALICSPWALWNLRAFGSVVQVSGMSKMQNHALFGHLPTASGAWTAARVVRSLIAYAWSTGGYVAGEELASPALRAALVGLLAVTPLVATVVALRRWRPAAGDGVSLTLAVAAVYAVAHALVYAVVMRSYATWYATIPLLLLAVLVGAVPGPGARRASKSARAAALALASLVALALYARFFQLHPPRPRGPERDYARWIAVIAREAPDARTIGLYNAGRPGYFIPTLGPWKVVNLDCVANNVAFEAWKRGRYAGYVERTIDLLLLNGPGEEPRAWMTPAQWRQLLVDYPRWEDRLQPGGGAERIYGKRPGR